MRNILRISSSKKVSPHIDDDSGALASLHVARGTVHDLYAASSTDAVAANAFGLGLAVVAAEGRTVIWAVDAMTAQEVGQPYAPGLNEMGFRPHDLLLVRTRDAASLLAVGEEALRSQGIGAVVLSAWGETKAFSLTASRRLSLAGRSSGTTLFLVRAGAAPSPSAAWTRWSIRSHPSRPLEANTPGRPAFFARLQRHREGAALRAWLLEWDRDRRTFVEIDELAAPLSGDLVSLASQRSAGPRDAESRHADALRRIA